MSPLRPPRATSASVNPGNSSSRIWRPCANKPYGCTACRAHSPGPAEFRLGALNLEGQAVLRLALGQWSGWPATLGEAADHWLAARNRRHQVGLRSLGAKLALYQGRLVDSFDRFAAIGELSLRRSGESWSAWGRCTWAH